MRKIAFIIVSLIITQSSFGASFKELQKIPIDSTNAEKMKIWFPVKQKFCMVKLSVFDSKMNLVREFFHQKINKGYYNIYWDKKDDSGYFVPEGTYKVATISCDYKRLEPILVRYLNGENAVLALVGEDVNNPSVELSLFLDSVRVSLEILNNRENQTAVLFSDSLITQQNSSLIWKPEAIVPTGNYFYKLKVNDFEQLIPFTYTK